MEQEQAEAGIALPTKRQAKAKGAAAAKKGAAAPRRQQDDDDDDEVMQNEDEASGGEGPEEGEQRDSKVYIRWRFDRKGGSAAQIRLIVQRSCIL